VTGGLLADGVVRSPMRAAVMHPALVPDALYYPPALLPGPAGAVGVDVVRRLTGVVHDQDRLQAAQHDAGVVHDVQDTAPETVIPGAAMLAVDLEHPLLVGQAGVPLDLDRRAPAETPGHHHQA
jgi:hypothetical protein